MAEPLKPLDHWASVAVKGVTSGARQMKANVWEWDVGCGCENPLYREINGAIGSPNGTLQQKLFGSFHRERGPLHRIEMWVRCRQCENCLKARATHWRLRAVSEMRACPGRTWFGTITLNPHEHFMAFARAEARLLARGTSWVDLTDRERQAERDREIGRELTLWLKRVRKESGAKLRYLLVAELHKSGLPHYHCLVHEQSGTVRHATLKSQWRCGFTNFKLVAEDGDYRAAGYVAKYISKSATCRIRASRDYGSPPDLPTPLGNSEGNEREKATDRTPEKQKTHAVACTTGALAPMAATSGPIEECPVHASPCGIDHTAQPDPEC